MVRFFVVFIALILLSAGALSAQTLLPAPQKIKGTFSKKTDLVNFSWKKSKTKSVFKVTIHKEGEKKPLLSLRANESLATAPAENFIEGEIYEFKIRALPSALDKSLGMKPSLVTEWKFQFGKKLSTAPAPASSTTPGTISTIKPTQSSTPTNFGAPGNGLIQTPTNTSTPTTTNNTVSTPGASIPTPINSFTPTATSTRTSTRTATRTATSTSTSTRTATFTPSPTPTRTPTRTPTPVVTLPPVAGADIKNPYYTKTEWKLWAEDSTPVTIFNGLTQTNDVYELPTTTSARVFPNTAAVSPWPGQFLPLNTASAGEAGFWDDAYKSEDKGHSMIATSWSRGSATINLSNQFLATNVMQMGINPSQNKTAGINFTSQSTTCMGHTQVEAQYAAMNERLAYFANTLRGSVGYLSLTDQRADRAIDSYKSLPVFAFHSFGRSGSEVGGLFKMLVTGGFMPRSTKNLLKRNGLYPAALLYAYKAALPYADANGVPVPYTNELRHRPGYLANGDSASTEFMPYNQWYHRYNEGEHFYTMTQIANSMSVAPPVPVLNYISTTRIGPTGSQSVTTTNTEAYKTSILNNIGYGETVSIKFDVGQSIDLAGRPLTFKVTKLYPEQNNLTIVHNGGTIYTVTAVYNANMPKGRLPVLVTANNGVYDSNPAIISFYPTNTFPPCGNEASNYETGSNPNNEMNVNLRPFLSSLPATDISVRAGQVASFSLTCSDPEGFATRYYRWLGERGTLSGNNFTLQTTVADANKTIALHFICSDGTGGYNSIEKKVIVSS